MNRSRLSILLIACLAMIACGGEPPRPSKTTIAVIPKGTTHEFWKSIHAGAVKAQRELDIEIIWKGPLKEDNREDQIALVETFIARGVSGIVLAPSTTRPFACPLPMPRAVAYPSSLLTRAFKARTLYPLSPPTIIRVGAWQARTWPNA